MNWCLGWQPPPESELIDAVLLAAGRALYVCNRFEANCRLVLRSMQIVDKLIADPVDSVEETFTNLPNPKMLGGALELIEAKADLWEVTEENLAILKKGKDDRNAIAHEGAYVGSLYSVKSQKLIDSVARLRSAVADVAAGDNIVSTWLYKIEEPREPVPYIRVNYSDLIDEWVFGHFFDDEDSSSWGLIYHQDLPGIPALPRRDITGLGID